MQPSDRASDSPVRRHLSPSTENDAVVLDSVSIKPSSDAELALRDITFTIRKSSFTMVVGPVGSGKSTLLKAILGELPYQSGSISIWRQKMGYCSQSVWLPNGKIREIITGYSNAEDIDQEWYNTTIHACALEEDIAQFSESHETVIGSKGLKLSGGQKQRLVCLYDFMLGLC